MTAINEHQERRDSIVAATLNHVPFDGWTIKALAAGVVHAGYTPDMALRAFPGGMTEVADHFADWSDRRMLDALEEIDLDSMRIRDRIHACVRVRLEINAPHREAIRRLLSFLSLPGNAPLAGRLAWRSCSHMWYAAGDRATDWNYYSKRGLLVSVYSSTILYWLADNPDDNGDFSETWAFLERRIDDVLKVFSVPRRLQDKMSGLPSPFRFFRAVRTG